MDAQQAQTLLANVEQLLTLLVGAAGCLCFAHGFNSGFQR